LGWRRSTLREIAEASNLPIAADPSNDDAAHDRVRIRRLLAEAPWLEPEPLAKSAAALTDAEEALASAAAALFATHAKDGGDHLLLKLGPYPPEMARRLLLAALQRFAPGAAPRGDQVLALIRTLEAGGAATLAGVKFTATPQGWRIAPAPPRR
jgi:tRNA(Ile)-lysidine synthase